MEDPNRPPPPSFLPTLPRYDLQWKRMVEVLIKDPNEPEAIRDTYKQIFRHSHKYLLKNLSNVIKADTNYRAQAPNAIAGYKDAVHKAMNAIDDFLKWLNILAKKFEEKFGHRVMGSYSFLRARLTAFQTDLQLRAESLESMD